MRGTDLIFRGPVYARSILAVYLRIVTDVSAARERASDEGSGRHPSAQEPKRPQSRLLSLTAYHWLEADG